MKILQIARHRNGVCGAPFYVVTFTDREHGADVMLAVVFDEPDHVAVLSTAILPDVSFGVNSWRGDNFEDELRRKIAEANEAADKKRNVAMLHGPQVHVTRSGIGGVYGHPVSRCDAGGCAAGTELYYAGLVPSQWKEGDVAEVPPEAAR